MPRKNLRLNKTEEANTVYVRLDEPVAIRKNSLSCAIDSTKMLKTYAEIKSLRETRFNIMGKMKGSTAEINSLVKDLERNKMPHLPLDLEEKPSATISKVNKHTVEAKEEPVEVLRLKKELEDIERKLRML